MKRLVGIEYCISWGYLGRAVALAGNLLGEHKDDLKAVSIIPSSGGVFEVKLDDELIFSKKELGRFPEDNEVEEIIKKKLAIE